MVYTENIEFEWDPKKAQSNFRKHGVTFEEAIFTFYDPLACKDMDHKHSIVEKRELIIGKVDFNTITVSFTVRNDGLTYRIISARRANEKEKEKYRSNRLLRHS